MSYEEWQYDSAGAADNSEAYYRVGMEYIDLENVIGAQQAADAGGGGGGGVLHQSMSVVQAGAGDVDAALATETYAV